VLCDCLRQQGIAIAHDCEKSGACATCRVVVIEGLDRLGPLGSAEASLLEAARKIDPRLRLSCQIKVPSAGLLIALPAS
jgi:2Fe-2S ferredoxin